MSAFGAQHPQVYEFQKERREAVLSLEYRCPLLAQSGYSLRHCKRPLSEVTRTLRGSLNESSFGRPDAACGRA